MRREGGLVAGGAPRERRARWRWREALLEPFTFMERSARWCRTCVIEHTPCHRSARRCGAERRRVWGEGGAVDGEKGAGEEGGAGTMAALTRPSSIESSATSRRSGSPAPAGGARAQQEGRRARARGSGVDLRCGCGERAPRIRGWQLGRRARSQQRGGARRAGRRVRGRTNDEEARRVRR